MDINCSLTPLETTYQSQEVEVRAIVSDAESVGSSPTRRAKQKQRNIGKFEVWV